VVWSVADGKSVFGSIGGGGVAFSPDGKLVASATDQESADLVNPDAATPPTVRVWEAASGKEVMVLSEHGRAIRQVAFAPDSKLLASVDWTGTLKLWDVKSHKEHRTIRLADFANLAFSPDGARLATADRFDRRVTLWDTASGEKLYSIPSHGRIVTAVAFAPDGGVIAAAGGEHRDGDRSVRLWPGRTDPEVTTFRGHTAGVWSAVFLPDGERIASVSGTGFGEPGQALLWDARTGRELRSFRGHTSIVFCAAVSPDGKTLATGSADKTVRLWEVETGRELKVLAGHKGSVMGVAFSPDGRRLVSVGEGHEGGEKSGAVEVRLWEVPGGREVAALGGVPGMGRSAAFHPDGSEFAVAADEVDVAARRLTGVVTLHNAADGKVRLELRLDPMTRVLALAYRPDGKRLAIVVAPVSEREAEVGTQVREFDFVTGEWRDLITARPGGPWAVAYSPDGRRLATGNGDGSVKIWDAATSRELLTLGGQRHGAGHVIFSPDGSRLASAGGDTGTVRVWDSTGK